MEEKIESIAKSIHFAHSRREDLLFQAMLRDSLWLYFINISDGIIEFFSMGEKGLGRFEPIGIQFPTPYDEYLKYRNQTCVLPQYRESYREVLNPKALMEYCHAGHEYYETEIEIYSLQGKRVWVRIRVCFQESEETHHLYGVTFVKEITEVKVLQEKQFRSSTMLEALTNPFIVILYCDLRNGTIWVERSEGGILPQGEELTSDYFTLISSYIKEHIDEKDQNRVLMETSREHTLKILPKQNIELVWQEKTKRSDGIARYMRCLIAPGIIENGEVVTFVHAIQDITAQKHREQERNQILQNALSVSKQANRAKTDFLSRMSHDIRTPMNAIIGMTAIAAAHLEDRDKVSDCLGKITLSGKHLLSLINEVLDMSKLENNKLELSLDTANLRELLQQMVSMLRELIAEKNQTITYQMEHLEHEDVVCDESKIRQILMNLLSNAIKYTPEGGHIKVILREIPMKRHDYSEFLFIVEDDGIGMSQAFLERIFQPFERAEDTRINKIHGTGLGMAIAQGIAAVMSGEITVKSEIGVGSCFTFSVPLQLENKVGRLPEDVLNLPVLVVDDQETDCQMACEVLDRIGLKGEWVTSGENAVNKVVERHAKGEEYFTVFLDWKMPGMDGIMTARAIREKVGQDVPIIILTAYDWCDIEDQARAEGVNDFLSKPISESKLCHTIERFHRPTPSQLRSEELPDFFRDKRLLLVEDNDLNVEIAKEMLETFGIQVDVSENGAESLQILQESSPHTYDLILMDIQMPIMNGYEATKQIRHMEREDLREIPIVAMTADAFAEDVRRALDAGMNGHIAKPLQVETVKEVLQKWI
ncbi:MAG: response regulator [Lachnospiraceae bacterium]|jgi:signal transduction histidine kinase/DNA-binding response OmpR family regulator|nr:response regulator [Lachnospiraceae bacterium]